jgi:hypothetical protein
MFTRYDFQKEKRERRKRQLGLKRNKNIQSLVDLYDRQTIQVKTEKHEARSKATLVPLDRLY